MLKLEYAKNHKNHEKIQTVRQLLMKPCNERSQSDCELLIDMIKDNDFFKNRQELKTSDLRDLALNFQIQEIPQFQNVFEFDDIGDTFYMIIKGIVSVQVPNSKVANWDYYWK